MWNFLTELIIDFLKFTVYVKLQVPFPVPSSQRFNMFIKHSLLSLPIIISLGSVTESRVTGERTPYTTANNHVLEGRDSCGKYICYSGSSDKYPSISQWLTFTQLFNVNQNHIRTSCRNLGMGWSEVSDSQIEMIQQAIMDEAYHSSIDARWILAIMKQEVRSISFSCGLSDVSIVTRLSIRRRDE